MTWDEAHDLTVDDGYHTVVEAADVDPVDVPDPDLSHEEVQALYAADPMWD